MTLLHSTRVIVQSGMRDDEAVPLEGLYARAFHLLDRRAALRETGAAGDFGRMLRDPRVDVFIVYDNAAADPSGPIAAGLIARDLAAVQWVSAEFYKNQWPDAFLQGRLYYVPYVVVDPSWQGQGPVAQLLAAMIDRVASERAVVGFDVNAFNEEGRGFVRAIEIALEGTSRAYDLAPVDQHTFYAATFDGTPAGNARRIRSVPPRRNTPPPPDEPEKG